MQSDGGSSMRANNKQGCLHEAAETLMAAIRRVRLIKGELALIQTWATGAGSYFAHT